jgi:hypothetical protein
MLAVAGPKPGYQESVASSPPVRVGEQRRPVLVRAG